MTWTADHIAYLRANLHKPDAQIAAVLNRTAEAVAKFRTKRLKQYRTAAGWVKHKQAA